MMELLFNILMGTAVIMFVAVILRQADILFNGGIESRETKIAFMSFNIVLVIHLMCDWTGEFKLLAAVALNVAGIIALWTYYRHG